MSILHESWAMIGRLFPIVFSFRSVISLTLYVVNAWALFTIAKRRGIRNYGLAWVPIGNLWILGSLSDQYRYVTAKKVQRRRALLLWLSIGASALSCVAFGATLARYIPMLINGEAVASVLLRALSSAAFAALAVFALSVWCAVYYFIVLYNVYASSDPGNATLYLVLSILFPVTTPFFLFACRNRDEGMPPRFRQPDQAWDPAPEPKEPWEK